MYKMAQYLVKMSQTHGFDGTMGVFEPKWTLPNAILFTMSTLIMIGYGQIAPRTFAGQHFCMAYSVFGLALMMLFLANIGNLMADGIKTSYSRLACRWCRVRRRWTEQPEKVLMTFGKILFLKYPPRRTLLITSRRTLLALRTTCPRTR